VRRTSRPLGRGGAAVAAVAVVGAVLAAVALPVLASKLLITDPNDTRGLLDIHEVRLRDVDGSPPSWTVITFSDWTTRKLWDRGYVLLNLDTLGTPETDYYALVRADRDRLRGSMWRHRTEARDVRLFNVEVRRRGDNGVAVWVPLRRLIVGVHRTVYRWSVTTLFTGGTCRRTCIDLAPDDSMVEQPIGTTSPTPSPT
jgi:hypothetical protein